MSPEQALQILDQVAGMVELKRSDWQQVQTALLVLQGFISQHSQPEPTPIPEEDKLLKSENQLKKK
jgi:hypothetical protein